MENENIKREDELNTENIPENEEVTEIENSIEAEPLAEEVLEALEETVETEALAEEVSEETESVEELTEEEIEAIEKLSKPNKKKGIIITAVIAAVLAVLAFFICYSEGVGGKTIVNHPIKVGNSSLDPLWSKAETDNIKYENPIVTLFSGKNTALTINGAKVDKGVMTFATNSMGLNIAMQLIQTGKEDINNFSWDKIDEETGLSYKELAKGIGIVRLIPIYAVIAEGEKRGIILEEKEEQEIKDWIEQQKQNLGDQFEEALKSNGYEDEATLYEMNKNQSYMSKVFNHINENIADYITPEMVEELSGDKVTVKHILVKFDEENLTDESKAETKKLAEEVLLKAKNGEDFDALIAEYNEDPGMDDDGYTFANDGTMVQSFADASFALKTGEISDLVETPYGYHIIKRIEKVLTAEDFTANDYVAILEKTVPVKIKKGVYDKIDITINLNDYFGMPEVSQTEETKDAE